MRREAIEKPIALDAYETLAERYAAMVDTRAENAYYERPATLSLLPDVRGLVVLDAGCGPGSYSAWLVEHGAEVVALDVSPKMVDFARRRLGVRAQVHLADLRCPLDFLGDASFDLVLSPLVLDYVEDWASIFAEFNRVLRPAGNLVFSMGHPCAEFNRSPSDNYFQTEPTGSEWTGFGIRVYVPYFRRPLSAAFSALHAAGFVVEQVVEPLPTDECREKALEVYEKLSRRPGFLCLRARKDVSLRP